MRINQSCSLVAVTSLLLVGWLERQAAVTGPRLRVMPCAPASVIFSLHAGFDQEKKFKHRSDKLHYHEGSRTTGVRDPLNFNEPAEMNQRTDVPC
ncbi:MAG: hypothetical protein CMJ81_06120 [Planctomycetaceae bacterium]|nr:hypothetical protein [Planctomycetaceae bacterium]